MIPALNELFCEDEWTDDELLQSIAMELTLADAKAKGQPITPALWEKYEEMLARLRQYRTETHEETP